MFEQYFKIFKNKHIIITGVSGFIGSHLAEKLLSLNAQVTGFDNFISGHHSNIKHLLSNKNFRFTNQDVRENPKEFLSTVKHIDFVFHFASPASPKIYSLYPRLTYQVNAFATHNILDFLYRYHPNARFIFASTSEIYGDPTVHPQPETYYGNVNSIGPRACYDEGKRLGETICSVYHNVLGVDTRIVRIFNTYGPRLSKDDGRVISTFINQVLEDKPITIQGDGSQSRSFCYITDLIEGILLVAAKPDIDGEVFNVGNPEEYTILETAKIIQQLITGKVDESKFKFLDLPKDDPKKRKPDISKIKKVLNWEPRIDFKTGLKKTIEFYKQNM